MPRKSLIVGAGGRDFHNFNTSFRENQEYRVVAFTAAQIPLMQGRTYPPSAAGQLYPEGIPIVEEEKLGELLERNDVEDVFFSYSDVSNNHVMRLAALCLSKGASFHILGPKYTSLKSSKPVIAVLGVRTGVGKSSICRRVVDVLRSKGLRTVVVRHPMAYRGFSTPFHRFSSLEGLDREQVTLEEREEIEPHLQRGSVVYTGLDYSPILSASEGEADVIVWDGGNNDYSFFRPSLTIAVLDATRPLQASYYFHGEANLRAADIVVINKVNLAGAKDLRRALRLVSRLNPKAKIVHTISHASVDVPSLLSGRKVLVVEDGPTITHGGMSEAAGAHAAKAAGGILVDPRKFAVGTIREAFARYPHIGKVLPALGYSKDQLHDLERSIENTRCEAVVLGTPVDLSRVISIRKPVAKVSLKIQDAEEPTLDDLIHDFSTKIRKW